MCPLQLPNPSLSRYYPIRFDEDKATTLCYDRLRIPQ